MHTRLDLLEELETITDVLMRDHAELGEFLLAERQQKVAAYEHAVEARTNLDRQHAGDLAALDLTTDVFRLKAKIAGHEARIGFIMAALPYAYQHEVHNAV